jgi:hypothetical protein
MCRKSRQWFDDEDPLSLLGTVFWMMVGFDEMLCSSREDDGIHGNDSYEVADYRVEAVCIMNNKASRSYQAAFLDDNDDDDDDDDDDNSSVEFLGVSEGPAILPPNHGTSSSMLSGSATITQLRGVPDYDNEGVENNKKASRSYQVAFVDDDSSVE